MKSLFFFLSLVLSTVSFANEQLGEEAVEMFQVLSHPQVRECMAKVPDMVDVSIERRVARCPGCTSYFISGHKRNIDVPELKKTVVKIIGQKMSPPFNNQTYSCSVSK